MFSVSKSNVLSGSTKVIVEGSGNVRLSRDADGLFCVRIEAQIEALKVVSVTLSGAELVDVWVACEEMLRGGAPVSPEEVRAKVRGLVGAGGAL